MISKRNYLFGTTVLASVLAMSTPGLAQTTPTQTDAQRAAAAAAAQEEDEVEEIIVTGSRIPRPQYEGTIPGAQVDRETIETRGFTNAIEILNDLPLTGPAVVLATGAGTPGNAGSSYVDLLDLGSARTLTLVNGRRFVSNNAGTIFVAGNETGSQVDASTIPGALIERVDVLTVGGAAAYGSDAIAGVINYILRDDFEGLDVRTSITGYEGGQGNSYSIGVTSGRNFFGDRANITLSGDYSRLDALYSKDFEYASQNLTLFANPFGVRNPNFVVGSAVSTANPAILGTGADGLFAAIPVLPNRTYAALPGGTVLRPGVFSTLPTTGAYAGATTGLSEPTPNSSPQQADGTFYSGGYFPSAPNLCNAGAFSAAEAQAAALANNRICNFAPATLPGTGAAQNANAARVFAAYGVAAPVVGTGAGQVTQATFNAIALGILQARNPTAREYYLANPGLDGALFAGSFIQGLPFVASGNPILPRTASPLRFNTAGDLVPFGLGTLNSTGPGSFGNAPGEDPDLYNASDRGVQRIQQERAIVNLNGRFDLTDNISLFTENLYSRIDIETPNSAGNSFNTATGATETSGVIVKIGTGNGVDGNPFLTAQNRAALAARGITNTFVLSTDYFDFFKDGNPALATSETFRTVNGVRGDFDLWNRAFNFELAYSYAGSDYQYEVKGIRDLEFLLAIDAVNDGGTIKCRSQTAAGAGVLGTSPPGIFANVVRTPGAGGIPTDRVFEPVVTADLIAGCKPLNLFGVGRASQEAIDYVTFTDKITNEARQEFTSGSFGGELIQLPAGPLSFNISGELRKESLVYGGSELGVLARGRSAPTAATNAEITSKEYGLELRIPIVSPDMGIPFVNSFDIAPAWRYVQQDGSATPFRRIDGVVVNPEYSGDVEEIYSIAATYSPVRDLTFRANVSRAVRQPDLVSLFLGSQPAFINTSSDVCGNTLITQGPNPAIRRANCIARVLQVKPTSTAFPGGVQTLAEAEQFLSTFGAANPSFQTIVAGDTSLVPEIANSYTWGFSAQPRFIPGLVFSADYLKITVKGLVSTLTTPTAQQFCYDSPTYPDTRPQVGLDLCPYEVRDSTFRTANGSISGFWNQGGVRVQALNMNLGYGFDISEMFGDGKSDFGRFGVRAQAYHLIKYQTSGNTDFTSNIAYSQDSLNRPQWEVQLVANYTRGPLRLSWTGNWQDRTRIYAGNGTVPATVDQVNNTLGYPDYWIHNGTIGYDVTDQASVQFIVRNIFDTVYPSSAFERLNTQVSLGRTLQAQMIYKF